MNGMLPYLIAIFVTIVSTAVTFVVDNTSKKISKTQDKISLDIIDIANNAKAVEKNKITKDTEEDRRYDRKIEELIQKHHEEAIWQSKVQFWLSVISSITGFFFIIIMLVISKELKWYDYIAKTFPGAIIEVVSILFFSQAKSTRDRASDFLNRLREDRQYEKSIDIVNTIEDSNLQSRVKAEIALHLNGIEETHIISNKE